jgi:TatA/E family protein of Tat protein translocase
MFGPLGFPELLLIFVVILIVFGPRRIPEIGRTLGKALGEFRKATDDLKSTIEREVRLEELKQVAPSMSAMVTPYESISRSEPVTPLPAETASLPPETVSLPVEPTATASVVTETATPPADESANPTTSSPETAG